MSTLMAQKCAVCSASLLNTQKWPTMKTSSMRSTTGKRNTVKQDLSRSSIIQPASVLSVEDEYIKQLQQQIYHLETECHYLRDQLNKNSTLINLSNQAEQERSELQRSLVQTSSQFEQLSSENRGLTIALDELRRKFDIEKQHLRNELDILQRAKGALEQENRLQDQELRRTRASSDEFKNTQSKVRILEQQLEQQLNQNKILHDELHHIKLEAGNLQRSLNDYQVANREKDRLHGIVGGLENEITTLRHELKAQDARYNEAQFLRNKLTDEKGALIREVTRLETLAKDFERELEQLRIVLREHADVFQIKEIELANLRKKEQSFRSAVDSLQIQFDTEFLKNKDLDGQFKQLQRELNIEIQNALNAKREVNEYELRHARLQDEINLLQNDRDHLAAHINALKQQLTTEENLTNNLRIDIQHLEIRVQEIDRLKTLEDLIQSQRWDDISQMAQTMQTVSRTMARATSPTLIRKNRMELQ